MSPPPAFLRAGLRSANAALRFRSSGRSRYRHRLQTQTGEISCPMQGTRQHSASFITIATTAVVSVLRFAADADLLWPMAALLFAIGQVFTVASRSWLFHFIATASPYALAAPFGGRHRDFATMPALPHDFV